MQDRNSRLNDLKSRLSAELQKSESDNNVIIKLTNEIAKLGHNEVRFSVDAGIINRLGKELVGKLETAVSELVKNAFDADATEVDLIFENAWQAGGTLCIKDNGIGMTRDQLINGFMRLSSSEKIHFPSSLRFNRTRAGRKGIGRFATQRLGKKLTIITQTSESINAIKVTINWESFATDVDLLTVTNTIEELPKTRNEGTELIIEDLREGWSDAMIKRVYRYTADLLQPFPLSKRRFEENLAKTDPGFKSHYYRRTNGILESIADEEDAIYKYAVAEIEGYVLHDGQGCWSLKSEKLGFPEEVFPIGKDREVDDSRFLYIKDVHFKCYYFIWEASLLPPQQMGFIKDIANERGGIRIYRNGFRVLPYGEKGNDWTQLDASVRKRVIIVPHANNSFFGFVELSDKTGDVYEETSSREGLIENNAFEELVDFVYRTIVSAVTKVADIRGRKATSSQKGFTRNIKTPGEKVDEAVFKIAEFVQSLAIPENDEQGIVVQNRTSNDRLIQVVEDFKEARDEEKHQLLEERLKLIDEINMLRILAGLGLVIGEFVHEVQRFLPGFDAEISYLNNVITNEEALSRIELLDSNIKAFTAYTSYFDKAISRNVIRELETIELRDVVKDFHRVIENDLRRSKIEFAFPLFEDYGLYTIPMHPSEWASILFNLYTNSKKAIIRSRKPGKIFIRCGKTEKVVFLEFSDTGDGIPKENEENIFNAFFTTTSAASHRAEDADSIVGTGLGLKILKDIVEAYGGELYVASPASGYNTTMRIEIPRQKKQIKNA